MYSISVTARLIIHKTIFSLELKKKHGKNITALVVIYLVIFSIGREIKHSINSYNALNKSER